MNTNKFAVDNFLAYSGDVCLSDHGGTFFNLNREHRENGYIEALRVSRLDDAPFSALILVESLTLLPDEVGSDGWADCMKCIGLTRAQYDEGNERERLWMDAEACLAYGRYDPAEHGYEHHTDYILAEELSEDALSTLETAGMKPDHDCTYIDADGDSAFDEGTFEEVLQARVESAFTDLIQDTNLLARV
jgi:hypothetical protein